MMLPCFFLGTLTAPFQQATSLVCVVCCKALLLAVGEHGKLLKTTSNSSEILSSIPSFPSYCSPTFYTTHLLAKNTFFIHNVSGHIKVTSMPKKSSFYSSQWVRLVVFVPVLFFVLRRVNISDKWGFASCLWVQTGCRSLHGVHPAMQGEMRLLLSTAALWYSSCKVLLQEQLVTCVDKCLNILECIMFFPRQSARSDERRTQLQVWQLPPQHQLLHWASWL